MKVILRQAQKKDLPALKRVLKPWADDDPAILQILESSTPEASDNAVHCTILETDKIIRCASLWILEKPNEVRVLALGMGPGASELNADTRFLREEILRWSEMGISKVKITVPDELTPALIASLKASGFMFEGISSCCSSREKPKIRLCKHFLNRIIPLSQVMSFLQDLLLSLGYEVRPEEDGFGYRIKAEYRLPFIFSSWHRITRSGPDIIVHPPARVLELHELETLFYPLIIRGRHERPLLLPMEKKRAKPLIALPHLDAHQNSLFDIDSISGQRQVHLNNVTYSYPTGVQGMRKGLPVLFYVNRMGAVGSGRVEDWYLDEPKNLYNNIDEMGLFDPEDVKEHAAASGPKAGKVLVIRFHWYRPLKRTVTLEQIRGMNETFNPQRTRSLSPELFQSILAAGNSTSA